MIVVKRIFNLVLPIALLIMVFMEVPQRSITDNDGVSFRVGLTCVDTVTVPIRNLR